MDDLQKRSDERRILIGELQALLKRVGSKAVLKLLSDGNGNDAIQISRPNKNLFVFPWRDGADIHTVKIIFKHSS